MDSTTIIITAILAALPATLLALATLISTIKGNTKVENLHNDVNGKFSDMVNALVRASKVEGKVETLEKAVTTPAPVIADRREK